MGNGRAYADVMESGAVAESPVAHHGDRVGNLDRAKICAAIESHIANNTEQGTQLNSMETCATLESAHTYGDDGVGDNKGGDTGAMVECPVINDCDRRGDGYRC